jgi:hypothetical protein
MTHDSPPVGRAGRGSGVMMAGTVVIRTPAGPGQFPLVDGFPVAARVVALVVPTASRATWTRVSTVVRATSLDPRATPEVVSRAVPVRLLPAPRMFPLPALTTVSAAPLATVLAAFTPVRPAAETVPRVPVVAFRVMLAVPEMAALVAPVVVLATRRVVLQAASRLRLSRMGSAEVGLMG